MLFGLGLSMIYYDQVAVGQYLPINDNAEPISFLKTGTNALNISEPIYQTIIGNFIDTKELFSLPYTRNRKIIPRRGNYERHR